MATKQITFDFTGLGGLVKRYYGDAEEMNDSNTSTNFQYRYTGGENEVVDGYFNPFKRFGYLSPANNTFETITTNPTSQLSISYVIDSFNNRILTGSQNGVITWHDTLSPTTWTQSYSIASVPGAAIVDMEVYQLNGVRKIFYSYRGSSSNIGVESNFSTGDAWLTGAAGGSYTGTLTGAFTPATGSEILMRTADNGYMYLLENNYVHKVDGTTDGGPAGTVTPNVLKFPTKFKIEDAIDYRGYFYIGINESPISATHYNAECGVYIWDRQSTTVRMREFIKLDNCRKIIRFIISPKGDLLIIVNTSNNLVEIRKFNGQTFQSIQDLPQSAGISYKDALTSGGNMLFWTSYVGDIYAYGSYFNDSKDGLYKIGKISDANFVNNGAGITIYGSTNGVESISLAYTTAGGGTNNKMNRFAFNSIRTSQLSAVQSVRTDKIFFPPKALPLLSNIKNLRVYMSQSGISEDTSLILAKMNVYVNQSTTPFKIENITLKDIKKGYKDIDLNKQYVNFVQVSIEYADLSSGGTDWMHRFKPSFGVLVYEDTTTQG